MTSRWPAWMTVLVAVQLFLAGLFLLFTYSLTSSLAQGATPSATDTAAMCLPLAMVALFGVAAWTQWRAGRRSLAVALIWAPVPLGLLFVAFLAI